MIVTPKTMRTIRRTVAVLLAAGIVVAASYALTPPFDPNRIQAAASAKTPPPGSEAALHQAMDEIQSGIPDYDRIKNARAGLLASLNPLQRAFFALMGGIPVRSNAQLLADAHEQKQVLADMGPLQSVAYLGGNARADRYRVTFQKGVLLWAIGLGKDGKLQNFGFDSPDPPTPQQWIASYASFSARERATRVATQLGVLLAAALFGRLALRVRL